MCSSDLGAQRVLDLGYVTSIVVVIAASGLFAAFRRRWLQAAQVVILVAGANLTTELLETAVFTRPFLDVGFVQSPMLHSTPTTLSTFMPGYGGSRVLLDGALTRGFDEATPLLIGLTWLLGLLIAVAVVYRRAISPPGKTALRMTGPTSGRSRALAGSHPV